MSIQSSIRGNLILSTLMLLGGACAQGIVVDSEDFVLFEDMHLVATGNNVLETTTSDGLRVTGDFYGISVAVLDPLSTEKEPTPFGSRTLSLGTGDALAAASFELDIPDDGTSTFDLEDSSGSKLLSATAGSLREIDSISGCSYTGSYTVHTAVLSNVSLKASASDHIDGVIALNGGTSSSSATFRFYVCFATKEWCVVMDADEASFERLQDRALEAYLDGNATLTAYLAIVADAAAANLDYDAQVVPLTSGAAARSTLVDLKNDILDWEDDGDLSSTVADDLLDACDRIIEAIDLNANHARTESLGATYGE